MEPEVRISFRGMAVSPAVEAAIRKRIEKLSRFYDRLVSCHVVVEAPHRHGHKGQIYHVTVDLSLPGKEIVVGREPELDHAHEDVYVAVRDSFRAARRRLEDAARTMGHLRVKLHPDRVHGRVVRLEADEGFGFIADANGTEFFFRRGSVEGEWGELAVGTPVRFRSHDGEQGPHATAVAVVGGGTRL